jgi:hypothetical protein
MLVVILIVIVQIINHVIALWKLPTLASYTGMAAFISFASLLFLDAKLTYLI